MLNSSEAIDLGSAASAAGTNLTTRPVLERASGLAVSAGEPVVEIAGQQTQPGNQAVASTEPSLIAIVTLVLWIGCLGIGVLGLTLSYGRPVSRAKVEQPLQAELVNIELARQPVSPLVAPPPTAARPLPLQQMPEPPLPAPLRVSEPKAVAFAVPVEAPPQVVAEDAEPILTTPIQTSTEATPQRVTRLTVAYGEGPGKQPAPEYPRLAVRRGQQGTVGIQFRVDENGRVLFAELNSPSPFPLLNEAALRVVRERWRFPPGSPQVYSAPIEFKLTQPTSAP